MNNVQERVLPTAVTAAGADRPDLESATPAPLSSPAPVSADKIDQLLPLAQSLAQSSGSPAASGLLGALGGGWSAIVAQLVELIEQLLSAMNSGGNSPIVPGNGTQNGNETYYQSADASSTGDPHLAFEGIDGAGNAQQSRFDSMGSHGDLLDSDSFAGGFRISTDTTQPGPKGVTYNREATVSTQGGRTQVSLDKDGNAYVMENGQRYTLAPGQSYDLGGGERVSRAQDGSVVVSDTNAQGGNITTTLRSNGTGVNVKAHAQGVDLGGDLVRGGMTPQNWMPIQQPPHHPVNWTF